MNQNQNIIPVMFEELQTQLNNIAKRLDNLQNFTKPTEPNPPIDDMALKCLEQQIQQIPKPDIPKLEQGQSAIT